MQNISWLMMVALSICPVRSVNCLLHMIIYLLFAFVLSSQGLEYYKKIHNKLKKQEYCSHNKRVVGFLGVPTAG